MKRQEYLDMMKKHEKELNEFPIAYAFSDKQLEEALEKLGAKKEECVTVAGHGDIMKKTDVPAFFDMMKRHKKELLEALKDPDFAEAAFLYEMDNHEYAINWSGDEDVLACFNLSWKQVQDMGLQMAWYRARDKHMEHAREWEMI
jgi:hypothetical protein